MRSLFFVFLSLFFVACSEDSGIKIEEVKKVSDKSSAYLFDQGMDVISGQPAYLYKSKKKLFFRLGKKELLIDNEAKSNKYWLVTSGKHVYVFWWIKFGKEVSPETNKIENIGKTLYTKVSHDGGNTFGEKVRINEIGAKPLPDMRFVVTAKGNAVALYQNEKYYGHQVFSNATFDGGLTWSKDLMLNNGDLDIDELNSNPATHKFSVTSPQLKQLGDMVVAVWQQYINENGSEVRIILSRASLDGGKTWEKEEVLFTQEQAKSAEISLFSMANKLFLTASYLNDGMYLFTKESGGNWKPVSGKSPDSEKQKYVSYLRADSDESFLYLSFVYVSKNGGAKDYHTGLVKYDLEKESWVQGVHQFDAVLRNKLSRGSYQDVEVLDDGTVVVVWQDYRRVLPAIYLSYSKNKGETWSTPIPLMKPGKEMMETPFIRELNNELLVLYHYYDLPEESRPKIRSKVVRLKSPKSQAFEEYRFPNDSLPDQEEFKEKLEDRFHTLMKARIKKNWELAWDFADPVYKNRFSKKMWIAKRDKLSYKEYTVDSIDINGPYATIKGKVDFSLTSKVMGIEEGDTKYKDMSQQMVMEWAWFKDDWYYTSDDPRNPYMP